MGHGMDRMEQFTWDVLVVGAGLAGFTAAARAAERGAQVLLIEKSGGKSGTFVRPE